MAVTKKKSKVSGKKKKFKDIKSDGAEFELLGNVYLVETLKGKEVRRTEIDPETVLKCLIFVLSSGLNSAEKAVGA